MSLFDQFDAAPVASYNPFDSPAKALMTVPEPVCTPGFVNASLEQESKLFQRKRVDYQAPSDIIELCVCNNIMAMAIRSNHIIIIDLDLPEEIEDVDLVMTKKMTADDRIARMFLDHTGRHVVISTVMGENIYLMKGQKKPKSLTKMKGIMITALAWNKAASHGSPTTREILIGSDKGIIYETELGGEEQRGFFLEKGQYLKQVYHLARDYPQPVTGLQIERFPGMQDKYFIVATTPTRIYQFVGFVGTSGDPPIFGPLLAKYELNPGFHEMPGDLDYSCLQVYSSGLNTLPQSLAWLTDPGIYYGTLQFSSQIVGDSVLMDSRLLSYTGFETGQCSFPLSHVLTEFHVLLLYPDHLEATCLLNDGLVYEDYIQVQRFGKLKALAVDSVTRTIWAYTGSTIFEIIITREHRDVWRLYMDKKQWDDALKYCDDNPAHRDIVLTSKADHFFDKKNYQLAATFYAATQNSFEQIALKFIGVNDQEALKRFLLEKLDCMRPGDKTHHTMLCTWLVELYLNQSNSLRDAGDDVRAAAVQEEFHSFLSEPRVKMSLLRHPITTYDLLASHGCVDNFLFFARLIEDYERVISHHIQYKEYHRALSVLTSQDNYRLFYKFSPILIDMIPRETVDAWMRVKELEPRKLIQSLIRYDHDTMIPSGDDESREQPHINHAIRFLEFCVDKGNMEEAIHNFLVTLYAKQSDDTMLLNFLHQRNPPRFDLKYALRLCTQQKKMRACIHIYSSMGLFEEAVDMALTVDIELAKANADKPEDDDELRKKLWLRIARHVVESDGDIKKAMEFLKHCDLLKIEDVLPFFPDFVLIDDFKDAICASLVDYNRHIDDLKSEMKDATHSARSLREDIQNVRNKYCFVQANETCAICSLPLLSRQFYLFPCQHGFHGDCLSNEVALHLDSVRRQKLVEIQRLIQQDHFAKSASTQIIRQRNSEDDLLEIDRLKNQLDDIVAAECIFCGEVMIKAVHRPFITEDEFESEGPSWIL